MAIAPSMRVLVQDIVSSREDRAKGMKKMQQESRDQMNAFHSARKLASGQLRSDLARGEADRSAEVSKIRKDLAKGRAERDSAVGEMLTSFRNSREETAKTLGRDLAKGRAERDSAVGEMLTGFRKSRKETARTLGKDLADFRKSREETAKILGKDLARGRAERNSAVEEMRADSRGARAAVIGDIHEARAAWQKPTRVTKKSTVETAPGKAEGNAKEAPVAEEDSRDLEAKLLAAVNAHPGGITLAEVAGSMGVAPIVFGRVSRKLLNEARIRKDDKLYFPVTGG